MLYSSMRIPDFETLLPRLVATYEAGRLVPFIGSGMSIPICTDWPRFIGALERTTTQSGADPLDSNTPRDVLIRRANSAVRTLKRRERGAFATAVKKALLSNEPSSSSEELKIHGKDASVYPSQTKSLARLWWPMVLSTNYDNCYAAAFDDCFKDRQLAVVGRSAEDCQRVLNSLSIAGRSVLWALQGYLRNVPNRNLRSAVTKDLEAQLVVGHEEYRRVTYSDLHFRRAFAEIFRQRSLLFLGAGLKETYLQELFGEVLEFYGPAARPHYAFIQEGEVDPDFMLARFQIVVMEYPKDNHKTIEHWLQRLEAEVSRPRWTPVIWSWGRSIRPDEKTECKSVPDFEVVRGVLPTESATGECLAVSAGGKSTSDQFFVSDGIWKVMERWGVETDKRFKPDKVNDYLAQWGHHPVYAARARDENDRPRLSDVYPASKVLFEHVAEHYNRIRMQLLAVGSKKTDEKSTREYDRRNYPERFSFIQTVRAWAAWRKKNPKVDCRLALHVVVDSVYQDIASGRIDVLELLSCEDIRFFVEVVSETGEVERRLFQEMPNWTLADLIKDLQLSPSHWTVKVTPPPGVEDRWLELNSETLEQTLQELGVVPGSTVHFHPPEVSTDQAVSR